MYQACSVVPLCILGLLGGSRYHLANMEDLCNSGLSQLMEATKELQLVESLIPEGSLGFGQCSWFDGPKITEDMELELDMNREDEAPTNGGWSEQSRPAKWRRKDAKGQGGPRKRAIQGPAGVDIRSAHGGNGEPGAITTIN